MPVRQLERLPGLAPLLARAVTFGARAGGDALPETTLAVRDVTVDPTRLAAYTRVCGLRLADELPATYPHVVAFPLQLALMSDPSFPLPLLGLVHVANRIVQQRPLHLREALAVRVHATDLRPHPRGRQVDVVTEVDAAQETAWVEHSTYLRRGGDGGGAAASTGADERPPERVTATWRIPADTGRRYAAVSGDRNPIHLHALTARPFGFPRPIAHGMWTAARCLAAFEGRVPGGLVLDTAFRKPLLLPATTALASARAGDGWAFALRGRDERLHLTGTLHPA